MHPHRSSVLDGAHRRALDPQARPDAARLVAAADARVTSSSQFMRLCNIMGNPRSVTKA